ncbi:uncharacterized protein LOC125572435 [Nematostella vectensis]|uniref:uncharacterized protein LOC125572435 n=1 Tax=Nematostella vectensis TaxID=45351 RepID=UPI002077038A|nr:uncharacterized protein LOC125572435 [Nematostella vectensis]
MMANTYDRFGLGLLLLLCLYIYPDLVFGATSFIPFEKSVAVIEGETASLVWNYTVDDRNTEFGNKAPKWFTYSTGTKELLMYDNAFASWSSVVDCPARYIGRISRKPVATLVIKNVTKNDAGNYSCEIEFNGPVLPIKAYIFLTVDDPPTSPPTKDQTIATTTGSPQGVTTTQGWYNFCMPPSI